MNKSILGLMGIALMAIGGTGCIAGTGEEGEEGSDDEVEVGEASDAFSEVYFWSTGSTVADSWGIGAKAGTGFLMGLSGNIGNGGATAAFASAGESVSQLVWEHNPVGGRALGSWVGTVQPPLNGSTGETIIKNFPSTTSGSSTVDLEAKVFGANRRCFLTAVRNNNSNHNAFQAVGDAIEILDVANKFQMRSSGRAGGSARCMNVTQVLSAASWAWGSIDKVIDMGANEAGMQCYLTGIGGAFRTNDYSKGASLSIRASDNHWIFKISANKFASAECSK